MGPRVQADVLNIREAWSQIPSPGSVETEFERFTGKRMERIVAIVVAVGSAALGVQALFPALGGLDGASPARVTLLLVVYIPLVMMLIACVAGRAVRITSGVFSIAYVVALAAWPVVVAPTEKSLPGQPWIFFLVNVGVVAAMLAFPLRLQFVWAVGVPLVYGYVRL